MHYNDQSAARRAPTVAQNASGLARYMASVYGFMGLGLAISGLIAFLTASSESFVHAMFRSSLLRTAILVVPFFMCMTLIAAVHKMSRNVALAVFFLYAGTLGFSLSYIFLLFSSATIVSTFVVSASLFFGMSVFGLVTKKDLTELGSFFFMGLLGFIIASLVSLFLHNSVLSVVLSVVAVVIFTGLTAFHSQNIKALYENAPDRDTADKNAILGALTLYLQFINIFVNLLRLFGSRK
ncbi:MAG: Bax inhibitor-1/YccA family protein [Holosporales bacterium]|jgi:FtsH-binding integral membrane protein|nr:Bax inhibitor-1/YccA family protein [Holosporales bacterium]